MITTKKTSNDKHIYGLLPNAFDNNYDSKTHFSLHISRNKSISSLHNGQKSFSYIQKVIFYKLRKTPEFL
jgi:hypothetical protein